MKSAYGRYREKRRVQLLGECILVGGLGLAWHEALSNTKTRRK